MALSVLKQTLEIEKLVGVARGQALLRAEALVSGAGREAIEVLLSEANLVIQNAETQEGRVVLDGNAQCQAVYRQGEESTLRALTAQTGLNHVLEVPGAGSGMACRVRGTVEHVEAKYENGHIVFLVSVGLTAQVTQLAAEEVMDRIEGVDNLETEFEEIDSVKLAAEASVDALLTESVSLPAALDARTALMDWATTSVESVTPDLGGVRVAGRVNVEALIGSGVTGRPVAMIKYPVQFDRLVELPDWLTGNVYAQADVRRLMTSVEEGEDGEDAELKIEMELTISVRAITTDSVTALEDAYTTCGPSLTEEFKTISPCVKIARAQQEESFRGTLVLPENAPGAGAVLAVRVRPVIGGIAEKNGKSVVEGILEASVMYMPSGSNRITAQQAELPFSISCVCNLNEGSWVTVEASAAEANALMRDRLELKCVLTLGAETRMVEDVSVVSSVEEGESVQKRPGIVLFWPGESDDVWSIAKRYNVPAAEIRQMNGGVDTVEHGKAIILRI